MENFKMEKTPTIDKENSWEYRDWQEKRTETDKICKEMNEAIASAESLEEKREIKENYAAQLLDAMQDERNAEDKYYELLESYSSEE